jgi:hypothetical protein
MTMIDTAAANALDDYEEGTWTPTAFGQTTAGTTTYGASRSGSYVKVGKLVTVTFVVQWTASTGSGDTRIGGLPFVSSNDDTGVIINSGSVAIADSKVSVVPAAQNAFYLYNATIGATGYYFATASYFTNL